MTASANENAHVLRRLNSPERARAIEEAARIDATAREEFERGQAAAAQNVAAPALPAADTGKALAQTGPQGKEIPRPQSMTEVLFNYAAGFAGVPGLAPRQGVDGSLDEGLGFHQDGTARKAGGVTEASGPSDRGQRANAYMRTGLQNGYGMAGYGAGLYDEMHYDLWGRNDPTRGGRVTINSRELGDIDPMNMAIDKGLNWGAGFVNSMGEAAISGLVDGGRARLNFRLDRDGYFSGEGDALLPFYDSALTTIYTQIGARSMHDSSDTRWIGNFGLGQRWFPLATGDDHTSIDYDAGTLMLGYNAFFDYDFTRDHQRGGIGAEIWYDWFRLGTNYYFPISSWKGSEDFDSRFVKERPAEGWDARVKAYLPFYRNVALTGAYSQWYGDRVGMFGADRLEKDPKVWSYGIEYTPFPLVSGFITQKSTERGRTATEFGLNFTYHFQMPWEDQVSHSKVAELRTVGGSRHEFVDRENRIILEYKAKNNFHIEFIGMAGTNTFRFRIKNGFDELVAGKTVYVSTNNNVTLAEAPAPAEPKSFFAQAGEFIIGLFSVSTAHAATTGISKVTDSRGEFTATVTSALAQSITITAQVGDSTASITVNVEANALDITTGSALPDATQNAAYSQTFAATGGVGAYTWAVTNGALPAGLSLNSNTGALTGIPTVNGTFSFTVTVTDGNGVTADKEFSLTVGAAALVISTASSLPAATEGDSYSQTLTATGGTAPYSFALAGGSSLPAGLTLSENSISGTPTASGGPFTFTVEVTDANSVKASKQFTLTVASVTYTVSASPASLRVDEVKTITFTLLRNGQPASDGTSVSLGYGGAGAFTSPPGSASVSGGSGQFTLNLTGQTAGAVTVTATIGGKTAQCTVTVNLADYTISLSASPTSTGVSGSSTLTATVTKNDVAVSGETVNFSWVVAGTSTSQGSGSASTSSGTATHSLTGSGGHRTLTVTATLQSDSSKSDTADVQFGDTLPAAIIAKMDNQTDTWSTANAYCQSQGGSLPNVNTAFDSNLPMQTVYWGSDSNAQQGLTHRTWNAPPSVGTVLDVRRSDPNWHVDVRRANGSGIDTIFVPRSGTRVVCVP